MKLPDNWTQQASNALHTVVDQALNAAEANPGEWVNPTPLGSKVRYHAWSGLYEIFGRYTPDMTPARLPPAERSMAETVLLDSLANDLRDGTHADRNRRYVEHLKILSDVGFHGTL